MRRWLVVVVLALAAAAEAEFVREPEEDTVMITDKVAGVKLTCYDEDVREALLEAADEEGEDENVVTDGESKDGDATADSAGDDDGTGVEWFAWTEGEHEHDATQVGAQFVDVKDGKSRMRWTHEEARPGGVACKFKGHTKYKWKIEPHFKVIPMPKSVYVTEGEDAYLECKLRPSATKQGTLTFTWTRYGEKENATAGEELPKPDETNAHGELHTPVMTNMTQGFSKLKIENAMKKDRAMYRCEAKLVRDNGEDDLVSSTHTLIRVKDRYSALYPFIGIVAEVLVLVVIIFICERRKAAAEDDEEDDDGAGNAASSSAAGRAGNGSSGSNVRQRRN